jgi:hypothetical protein
MSSERNPEYRVGQAIWRARTFGAPVGAVVRYGPFLAHNHTTKSGLEYCGAQIIADEGANWRAKVRLAPSIVGERTFAKALAPQAVVGDGIVLRVEGAAQTVAEVLDAKPTCPGDQARRVAAGEFWPGAIPDHLYDR